MKKCGNRLICVYVCSKISKKVADSLGYNYPDYDENVTKYLETQREFQINIFMVIGIDKFQFVE